MLGAAVAARTRGQGTEEIYLGKEFKEVARSDRARLHEVLPGIAGKPCAHEDVQHVMHRRFNALAGAAQPAGEGARQVRMAAVMVFSACEKPVAVGVMACNHR